MSFEKPNVLIVDDEEHIRTLLFKLLNSINFGNIKMAPNGLEAIKMFNEDKPDLILLDINMPIMTGEDVIKQIRNSSKDVCIIILTIFSDEETIKKFVSLGAEYFIVKDIELSKIVNVIEKKWEDFKKKQKEKLLQKHNLNEILKEINEEEKLIKYN